ncbi:CotH kinase family protein [Actinoplanes sp. CA-051413]|uniref:CotH kinase family protein n=1 Tax=Actinoplanes sp. CA-051413 TaxID=3239899 RepID=UPI003D992A9C
MGDSTDGRRFRDLFENRAVVIAELPSGRARDLAVQVHRPASPGDSTLRTGKEFDALFAAILHEAGPDPAAVARLVDRYRAASVGREEFFSEPMYQVQISDWQATEMRPEEPVCATGGARIALWRIDPQDQQRIPGPESGTLFSSSAFTLVNSGNRTKYAPKRSWKIAMEPGDDDGRIVGMARLNLKSMYNDPSQMREGLALALFRRAGVPAARRTYARLAINGAYQGLYSLVEQLDRVFLSEWFGANDRGNLYKTYCGDVGCATLERRVGADGDDGGRQYFTRQDSPDLTYRLETNEDDSAANGYDDLAEFIRVINGTGLPGAGDRFDTDLFRESVESVMNVRAFLRWAGLNVLLGAWDNYFATPANYYLFNSGRHGAAKQFMTAPYFTFIPCNYDNCLGIDYFDTRWQDTDLLDWPGNTGGYHRYGGKSRLPLIQNLLANHEFAQYYLDHLEHLLDTDFNTTAIDARTGTAEAPGLWQRVSPSAYLEADFPNSPPFTGRPFTNDEVYRAGYEQQNLRHGNESILGIRHYVWMRCDSARAQLAILRKAYPAGTSSGQFTGALEPVPGTVKRTM